MGSKVLLSTGNNHRMQLRCAAESPLSLEHVLLTYPASFIQRAMHRNQAQAEESNLCLQLASLEACQHAQHGYYKQTRFPTSIQNQLLASSSKSCSPCCYSLKRTTAFMVVLPALSYIETAISVSYSISKIPAP